MTSIDVMPRGAATVHRMPCEISHDGPAKVNQFFKPQETKGKR